MLGAWLCASSNPALMEEEHLLAQLDGLPDDQMDDQWTTSEGSLAWADRERCTHRFCTLPALADPANRIEILTVRS